MKDLIKIEIERATSWDLKELRHGTVDSYEKVLRELFLESPRAKKLLTDLGRIKK